MHKFLALCAFWGISCVMGQPELPEFAKCLCVHPQTHLHVNTQALHFNCNELTPSPP